MPQSVQQKYATRQRQREALSLRLGGATYRQIARQVGYANPGSAYKAVNRALREVNQGEAEELHALELERLNDMLSRIWPLATNGDHPKNNEAVRQALAIMRRMDRVAGID